MGDRYRYPRPRSPIFNPARTSLPINISGWASDHHHDHHDHHLHAIPSSRREILPTSGSRSSSGNMTNPPIVTTYKIKTDPQPRVSSTRSRRSSTMDSSNRPPAIITTTNRQLRPVIHSGGDRAASPMKSPYRSSEEDYYTLPASSQHGHHRKRYSATMDNADMTRLAHERDSNRLRIGGGREGTLYVGTRARQAPSYPIVRRSDVEDYGEDGYNYTGPRDLVQYDLNNSTPRHPTRRDSSESSRRPTSISGYNDVLPRSYDSRERGPPPTTRGLDRIQGRVSTWDPAPVRMPVSPMDPIPRPAPFDPVEPVRRTNSARPQNLYHDNRDSRRTGRDDRYEVRDDRYEVRDEERRKPLRKETYDDEVEQRGFGIRADKPERSERAERSERSERSERVDRPIRSDRPERYERDYPEEDRPEHKGRDALATGISIAGAALGLNTAKNSLNNRDDKEDREDRKRREYDDDLRRRRERDERELVDSREVKERRYREDERDRSPRDFPQSRDRDVPPPPRDSRDMPPPPPRGIPPYVPESPFIEPGGRDSRERQSSRDERDLDLDRRERRPHPALSGTAIDDRSDGSDGAAPSRTRRESRNRRESTTQQAPFDPKNTMDLKALKDALNAKDGAPPPIPPKEPLTADRTPRGSMTRDPREVADIRSGLDDRRSRDVVRSSDDRQLRVVSPPREKQPEVKPVKGILRQPRPAFPEDPSPVREGVAPLKDAKKDGVPPDARWTKISRKLVNPEALDAGKERYEARDDFVIVLRVLSRDEVQGYAEITQRIRAAREEAEATERRHARRERHERHKRERNGEIPSGRRRRRHRDREHEQVPGHLSNSESDTTEDDEDDDRVRDAPRMLEGAPRKRAAFAEEPLMSGGLGPPVSVSSGGKR